MEAKLAGRITTAYACSFKCFASCPETGKVCGDQCSNSVPQLNVTGTSDKYFGKLNTSVASGWLRQSSYGVPITGTVSLCAAPVRRIS